MPILGVVAVSSTAAAIVYLPVGLAQWPAQTPSPEAWLSVAGLGVICTGIAFLIFFALIAEVGPARATVITYINPAIAVTLGVVVLNEAFTASIAAGFALILAGSVLATGRNRNEKRDETSDDARLGPGASAPAGAPSPQQAAELT